MSESYVDLARLYVERSNLHDLDLILPMFDEKGSYHSAYVGTFEGRNAIGAMMRGFFKRFPNVTWEAREYQSGPDSSVEFEFVMHATNRETGERIERHGSERIVFTVSGLITYLEVQPKPVAETAG